MKIVNKSDLTEEQLEEHERLFKSFGNTEIPKLGKVIPLDFGLVDIVIRIKRLMEAKQEEIEMHLGRS